ncbi:MAG: phosphomethylpyrimidine synthase ThiC [Desulfovibrionaceae bacterium]|nr:phosphomethylpyrimidine synthase ThiC [Desulfovibrionaceae bacterium]
MDRNKNSALAKILDTHLSTLAKTEGLEQELILAAIDAGTMVCLANPNHQNLTPLLVGQPAKIKVNANIGTSPLSSCLETELEKLKVALEAGADTVMDLSTAGDLDQIRQKMLAVCPKPVGTVPIYSVGQKLLDHNREISSMTADELLSEIENQCQQGVDFITVHCGLTKHGATLAKNNRTLGIVSRGGSMLARWMLENDQENPLLTHFDRLLEICRPYNVTLSLGDGLRPGAGCDAGDNAQWDEVLKLDELCQYAQSQGVQCMIEGPGHMSLDLVYGQIQTIKTVTHHAPLYVLGPLVCDSSPGYDHISGAIGGAIGVQAGVDFLCYLTPAEHLTLPDINDVKQGVMASRIAGHIGEVALRRPHALEREKRMNAARRDLNWEEMKQAALDPGQVELRRREHKNEEVCAMCGKFCSVKMLKDLREK